MVDSWFVCFLKNIMRNIKLYIELDYMLNFVMIGFKFNISMDFKFNISIVFI